jgi:nitrogen fixation NifU-like protein
MDLYAETILDHYRNPHHYGRLDHRSLSAKDSNPLCGDMVQFDLLLDKDNRIENVGFTGHGCAISQASASMLTDLLIGRTLEEAVQMTNEDIYQMLGVPLTPARVKCAILSLITFKKAIPLDKFM